MRLVDLSIHILKQNQTVKANCVIFDKVPLSIVSVLYLFIKKLFYNSLFYGQKVIGLYET